MATYIYKSHIKLKLGFLSSLDTIDMDAILNISDGEASGKEPACQCRRHKRREFDSWFEKIPWRRTWQSAPVFLPVHGQRSLAGYSPYGCKESDMTEQLNMHAHTILNISDVEYFHRY